jgi:glycosyltransferase involved in cell wall biosynthesis
MSDQESNPDSIKSAEIVVGIPSYNEATLIPYPTQQASLGLSQFFADKKSVIINCDNNSTDGTKEAFLKTPTEVPKIYISTPPNVRGKGNNLRNFFNKVCELEANACLVVDADLKSITPRWIRNLAEPLFRDFGFVAPLYVRHKYDGTITNNIAFPLIRTLYGRRVRQPIGGDFGFSGQLAQIYANSENWDEAVSQFGIDIWMTSIAIYHNVSICQAFMGRPKIHKAKDPGADLGPMFRQVVGTIFSMMTPLESFWKSTRWSKPTAIFGFGLGEVESPPSVDVNRERLHQSFLQGFDKFEDLWKEVLTADTFSKLIEVRELEKELLEFPTQLWARVLFDYAVGYHRFGKDREDLLDSLIPLYHGKIYCFVKHTEGMSTQQAEEYIEDQCLIFEETKPYLDERWD